MIAAAVVGIGYCVYWLVTVAIPAGYSVPGTGFGGFVPSQDGEQRAKTLWDWMQLIGTLAVPVAVAGATFAFGIIQERTRRLSEQAARNIEAERARETALQNFLDDIGQLIREDKLGLALEEDANDSERARYDQIRALAMAKTRTMLDVLTDDEKRRLHAVEFLGRAALISKNGLDLTQADLSDARLIKTNMQGAMLSNANMQGSNLFGAFLQGAWLDNANLQGVRLDAAKLQGAKLDSANLQRASLEGANLQGAQLYGVDLRGALLASANLEGAQLGGAQLQGAQLYWANLQRAGLPEAEFNEDTLLPDGTKWNKGADLSRFTNPNHPSFWTPSKQGS